MAGRKVGRMNNYTVTVAGVISRTARPRRIIAVDPYAAIKTALNMLPPNERPDEPLIVLCQAAPAPDLIFMEAA